MRYEKIISRDCGTQIRLIVQGYRDILTDRVHREFFAAVREPGQHEEKFVHPHRDPSKSLHGMSVDEYIHRGRKGLLAVVRPGEILKAGLEFNNLHGIQ